jgi:endonuclease YncB( thermonuclease family)
MKTTFMYPCIIKRIVDGDTVQLDLDMGFRIHKLGLMVRLMNFDAPELFKPKSEEERIAAQICTDKLSSVVSEVDPNDKNQSLILESKRLDIYNRALGILWIKKIIDKKDVEWINVNDIMTKFIDDNKYHKRYLR